MGGEVCFSRGKLEEDKIKGSESLKSTTLPLDFLCAFSAYLF